MWSHLQGPLVEGFAEQHPRAAFAAARRGSVEALAAELQQLIALATLSSTAPPLKTRKKPSATPPNRR